MRSSLAATFFATLSVFSAANAGPIGMSTRQVVGRQQSGAQGPASAGPGSQTTPQNGRQSPAPQANAGSSGDPTGPIGTHASPINAKPSGSPTPIAQPTANSLDACLADCKGNTACVNYIFESGVCSLFGPTTVRRQAGGNIGTHAAPQNAQPAGNPTPIAQPKATSLDACLADCKANPACINYVFASGTCKLFGPATVRRQAPKIPSTSPTNTAIGTHDAPKNAQPAGNPTPIAQPQVASLDVCLAYCKANPTCVNYIFTSGTCKLFGSPN